jgi:hypothetical protein
LGHLDCGRRNIVGGNDHTDESERRRSLRRHRLADEQELGGDMERDTPWEADCSAATGHLTAPYLRQTKLCGVSSNDQVARKGYLEAPAERKALHPGDERLHRALADDAETTSAGSDGPGPSGSYRFQVHTCGEDAALRQQHAASKVIVLVEQVKGRSQELRCWQIDRVADVRSVQRDHEHVAIAAMNDRFLGGTHRLRDYRAALHRRLKAAQ